MTLVLVGLKMLFYAFQSKPWQNTEQNVQFYKTVATF